MVIHSNDRRFARHLFRVAVGMVERLDPAASDAARAALDRPSKATIRALLDAGRGKLWLPSVHDALAEVAAAAAEDVLGGDE